MFRGDGKRQKKHTAGMQQIKNTHRPDVPRAARLPTHGVDRDVIKHRGPSELMAVGVKNGGHESGPLWRYGFYSCLRWIGKGCAHILPINIRPQVFRLDVAHRLNADAKAKALPQLLTDRHRLAQVTHSGTAALGEGFPIFGREAVEICA